MPTPIAAPSIASRAFDFQKPAASFSEASNFASSLQDARQKLPSKPADKTEKKADAIEPTESVEKTKSPEHVEENQSDVEAEPTREVAAKDDVEGKDEHNEQPGSKSDEVTAMAQAMAALAAMQPQPSDDATQAQAADVEQTSGGNAASVLAAAAATVELPDDATVGNELAGQPGPSDPNTAKPANASAKPGDAKLDKLTAEMTPVDGSEIADAVTAAQATQGNTDAESGDQGDESTGLPMAEVETAKPTTDDAKAKSFDELFAKLMPDDLTKTQAESKPVTPKVEATPLRPEQQFHRDNVDRVVNSVQSQVNASGNGSMRVRLDPPELGALDVAVKMLNGKMTASFTTSNDQATQMLSHSLSSLKTSLENAGIAVDRIEVRQAAPSSSASSTRDDGSQQQQADRGFSSQQQQSEQQRKQMVDRLWRKYAYGTDEVDLVA